MNKNDRISILEAAAKLDEIQNNLADAELLIEAQKKSVYQLKHELLMSSRKKPEELKK